MPVIAEKTTSWNCKRVYEFIEIIVILNIVVLGVLCLCESFINDGIDWKRPASELPKQNLPQLHERQHQRVGCKWPPMDATMQLALPSSRDCMRWLHLPLRKDHHWTLIMQARLVSPSSKEWQPIVARSHICLRHLRPHSWSLGCWGPSAPWDMGMALAPQNLPNSVSRHARLQNTHDHHP